MPDQSPVPGSTLSGSTLSGSTLPPPPPERPDLPERAELPGLGAVRTRRGAHRERRSPWRAMGALGGAAVLLVAVTVAGGRDGRAGQGAAAPELVAGAGPSPVPSSTAHPWAVHQGRAGAHRRAAETASGPAASGPAASGPAAAGAAASGPASSRSADRGATTAAASPGTGTSQGAAVVVLNETRVRGLADTTATRLRASGWQVTGVGNFQGRVPATTVYYPPGRQVAAQRLAAGLPGAGRVRPRFRGLPLDQLTVVLAGVRG